MLRSAFNALTKMHSRPVTIKRLGNPNIYSPARVTPTNYFRFLRGPEYTNIPGVEFIIPVDTLLGQFAQKLAFDVIPSTGDFKITYGAEETGAILFSDAAVDIQTELRLLTGMSSVIVTGSFATGFYITFVGFDNLPGLGQVTSSTLDAVGTFSQTYTKWDDLLKRGDRILDGSKLYAIDEIMEMHDLGTEVMGFRTRCE